MHGPCFGSASMAGSTTPLSRVAPRRNVARSVALPVFDVVGDVPDELIQTVLVINPGDEITASVRFVAATSVFTIKVTDVTSGKSFTRREQCASGLTCDRSSADVITEDVGRYGGSGYFPLANYGTMGYTKAKVTDTAGETGTISASEWLNGSVTEKEGTTTYATVTPLSAHGSSFDTVWNHQ